MAIAANLGPVIHFTSFFLKAAYKHHLVIVVQQRIAILTFRQWLSSLLADRCRALRIRLLFAFRIQDTPDPFLSKAGRTGGDYPSLPIRPTRKTGSDTHEGRFQISVYEPGDIASDESGISLAPQRGQSSGGSSLCITSPHTGHIQCRASSLTRSARLTMPI